MAVLTLGNAGKVDFLNKVREMTTRNMEECVELVTKKLGDKNSGWIHGDDVQALNLLFVRSQQPKQGTKGKKKLGSFERVGWLDRLPLFMALVKLKGYNVMDVPEINKVFITKVAEPPQAEAA